MKSNSTAIYMHDLGHEEVRLHESTNPADRVGAVWFTYGAVWNEMVSLHTPQQIGGKKHYRSGSHKGITFGYTYLNM